MSHWRLRPSDSQRKNNDRRGARSEVGVRALCPGLSLRAAFTPAVVTVLALLCNKQRLAGVDWIIGRENALVSRKRHELVWLACLYLTCRNESTVRAWTLAPTHRHGQCAYPRSVRAAQLRWTCGSSAFRTHRCCHLGRACARTLVHQQTNWGCRHV